MKERPILFSSPMIKQILSGSKSQTRRVVKTREPLGHIGPRGSEDSPVEWGYFFDGPSHNGYMVLGRGHDERQNHGLISIPCPYGEVGDRLWCRETWQAWRQTSYEYNEWEPETDADRMRDARIEFRATSESQGPWRPSIFMPRWASRITLEITEVRVQRLWEISEDDAKAEGVEPYTPPHGHISPEQKVPGPGFDRVRLGDQPHRLPFADLWDKVNGHRRVREYLEMGDPGYTLGRPYRTVIDESTRWEANPFVWAVSFRRVMP